MYDFHTQKIYSLNIMSLSQLQDSWNPADYPSGSGPNPPTPSNINIQKAPPVAGGVNPIQITNGATTNPLLGIDGQKYVGSIACDSSPAVSGFVQFVSGNGITLTPSAPTIYPAVATIEIASSADDVAPFKLQSPAGTSTASLNLTPNPSQSAPVLVTGSSVSGVGDFIITSPAPATPTNPNSIAISLNPEAAVQSIQSDGAHIQLGGAVAFPTMDFTPSTGPGVVGEMNFIGGVLAATVTASGAGVITPVATDIPGSTPTELYVATPRAGPLQDATGSVITWYVAPNAGGTAMAIWTVARNGFASPPANVQFAYLRIG